MCRCFKTTVWGSVLVSLSTWEYCCYSFFIKLSCYLSDVERLACFNFYFWRVEKWSFSSRAKKEKRMSEDTQQWEDCNTDARQYHRLFLISAQWKGAGLRTHLWAQVPKKKKKKRNAGQQTNKKNVKMYNQTACPPCRVEHNSSSAHPNYKQKENKQKNFQKAQHYVFYILHPAW